MSDEKAKFLGELKRRVERPKSDKFWIEMAVYICLMSFFCGIIVGSAYYSQKVNNEVQKQIDILMNSSSCFGQSWNPSIDVPPIPIYKPDYQDTNDSKEAKKT